MSGFSWLLLLSYTQNSSETVSSSVFHTTFSKIIFLHGRFSINLLYDLMKFFFKDTLDKAASEKVSLLVN